jgi:nucleotide-binding universal stress UspA family protein
MKILHFSKTPLAGSPIRICKALSLIDGVSAHFVVLNEEGYGKHSFEHDLIWQRDRENILKLTEEADILHLHNYINLDTKEFAPINFSDYWKNGKAMVRQFHSTDQLISRMSGETPEEIQSCPIPKLVISQYPERFYPTAKLVPNIVFDNSQYDTHEKRANKKIRLCYSPSNFRPSRSTRWDTKGYPETIKLLKRIEKRAKNQGTPIDIDIIEQASHAECLRRKALADIAIDDLVTGSYHMNTLESLIQGSAVLTFTDQRVLKAAGEVSGKADFPALNVRLEETEQVILELIKQPKLVRQIGEESRQWMLDHWAPKKMAEVFLQHYNDVLKEPRKPFEPRFSLDTPASVYRNITLYDSIWKSRHSQWPKELPTALLGLKSGVGGLLRRLGLR